MIGGLNEKACLPWNLEIFSVTSDRDVFGAPMNKEKRTVCLTCKNIDFESLFPGDIVLIKTALKDLTLFLYPRSDKTVSFFTSLCIQQYFMVSNTARLLKAVERGSNVHDLADYVVIQINVLHRNGNSRAYFILTERNTISRLKSVTVDSLLVAYTNRA